jgi:hypothetical protein
MEVTFTDKRKHRITVSEIDDAYELHGFVIRQKLLAGLADFAASVWLRNCATELVGFASITKAGKQERLGFLRWVWRLKNSSPMFVGLPWNAIVLNVC